MGFLFFVRTDQCGIPRISGNAGKYADMAELADAPDLGSGVHDVQVQVLLSAVVFFSCLSRVFIIYWGSVQ